jgi:hypothetical protein
MNIGFAGCSFTYGTELKDPKNHRWSKLVCDALQAKEYNFSTEGASNEMICMKTVEEIVDNPRMKYDFMVIQFTSSRRFSIAGNDTVLAIGPNYRMSRNKTEDLLSKLVYSDDTRYMHWYRLFRWKMITLHHFLNQQNINHLFVFMLESETTRIKRDFTLPKSLKGRCVLVGLREYCTNNNIEVGPHYHPLETGHYSIANEIILPRIKELL